MNETSVKLYETTLCNIPEDSDFDEFAAFTGQNTNFLTHASGALKNTL
jgi:hypothetical protein